jgi:hypothetical protein
MPPSEVIDPSIVDGGGGGGPKLTKQRALASTTKPDRATTPPGVTGALGSSKRDHDAAPPGAIRVVGSSTRDHDVVASPRSTSMRSHVHDSARACFVDPAYAPRRVRDDGILSFIALELGVVNVIVTFGGVLLLAIDAIARRRIVARMRVAQRKQVVRRDVVGP